MLGSIGVAGEGSIDVAHEDEAFSKRSVTGERIVRGTLLFVLNEDVAL